jgi:DNA gyrase subunit A
MANMHDDVLFITDRGVVFKLKVYNFPESGRQAKGLPIVNLLPISQEEKVTAVIPLSKGSEILNLVMLTENGWIKRIELNNFENIRTTGIIAIGLEEGDKLNWVSPADSNDDLMLGTSLGMAIRFPMSELRPLGRTARGVTAIKLRAGDKIVDFSVVKPNENTDLLIVTNDGFGKRSSLDEFRAQGRGGIGLIATKFKNAKSRVASITTILEEDELMMVTANGVVVRMNDIDIPRQARQATGVRLQNLDDSDMVSSDTRIISDDQQQLPNQEEPQA